MMQFSPIFRLTLFVALSFSPTFRSQGSPSAELDSSFAIGTGAGYPTPGAANWGQVQAVAVQPDGKVLAGGQALFTNFNGTPVPSLVRINVDGTLDTAFQANVGTGPLDNGAPEVNSIVVQPDGKILIGGPFTTYNGTSRRGVARLNANGSLDTSFLAAGGGVNGTFTRYVNHIALQLDGKVLIAGGFNSYQGINRPGLARLNADGSLDSTFNPGAPAIFGVNVVGVAPDGKIYAGGGFTNWLGLPTPGIVRLFSNGALDSSFLPNHTSPYPSVGALSVLSDGRVLIGGFVEGTETNVTRNLARLNADGTIDSSYPSGGVDGWVADIVPWPEGGHLIMGRFRTAGGQPRGELALIDDSGNVDLAFAPPPIPDPLQDLVHIYTAAVAPDGRIVFGGWFTNYPNNTQLNGQNYSGIGRLIGGYLPGPGTLQFASASFQIDENVGSAAIQITRFGGSSRAVTVNYNTISGTATAGTDFTAISGTLSWNAGDLSSRVINIPITADALAEGLESFSIQLTSPTGGATLGRNTATVNVVDDDSVPSITAPPQSAEVLLSFGTTFRVSIGPGLPAFYQWLSNGVAIANATNSFFSLANIQTNFAADYSVIVSNAIGAVTSASATLTVKIPAGLPDPSFVLPGVGFNGDIYKMLFADDGGLIAVGTFSQYGGITVSSGIIKLLANGSRDASFPPGAGANNLIQTIAAYPDGRFLIGGNFTQYSGTNRSRVARLLPNGALDTSFSNITVSVSIVSAVLPLADGSALIGDASSVRKFTPSGTVDSNWFATPLSGQVYALVLQSDGKILATAWRSSFPAGAELVRLNADGTRDRTFANPGRFVGGQILTINPLPDGRIFVGGGFSSLVAGETTNALPYAAIIHPNGTRDVSFNVGNGPNGSVIEAFVQGDGRILVGGSFGTWNGVAANLFTRLLPTGQVDPTFVIGTGANSFVRTLAMDASGRIAIGGSFTLVNGQSRGKLAVLTGDAGAIQLASGFAQVAEQSGSATVTLERVAGSRGAASVYYTTEAGTAGAADFTAVSGTISWVDGEFGPKTFQVPLTNDAVEESDETFTVILSNFTGAVSGFFTNQTIQILDDESKPRLAQHPTGLIAAEETAVTFTASGFSALPFTFQWRSNGVAIVNATNATLTLFNVQSNYSAIYSVRLTNARGFTDSSNALFTVIASPTRRDASFSAAPAFNGAVRAIYPLGDGRVMVGGDFTQPRARIALLTSNGVVDASFTNTATSTGGSPGIYTITRDRSGRWLIGGSFSQFGGIPASNLVRLNPNHTVDTNFLSALWTPPNGIVRDIAEGLDGKIWVAGDFTSAGGPYGLATLIRLHDNGAIDLTFRARPANNQIIRRVVPLANGGALIGGLFTSYDGFGGYLVKILADGTVDRSYAPSISGGAVYDLLMQPDGGVFAAGLFSASTPRLVKLRPNGSTDTGFLEGTTANGAVNSIALQSNGRLVAGGAFTALGIHTNRFTRVNADGTQDASLSLGSAFSGEVHRVAVEHTGTIWVGGSFTTYKGVAPAYLVRLIGDEPTVTIGQQPFDLTVAPGQTAVFTATAAGKAPLNYQWLKDGIPISNGGNVSGANSLSLQLTGVATNDAAIYSLVVSNNGGDTATSLGARLVVQGTPIIIEQPAGTFVPQGARLALTVIAEGAPVLGYRWSKDGVAVGANAPIYVVTNTPTSASGNYSVIVSNAFGAITSVVANVTVAATPATAAPGFLTEAGSVNTATIFSLQPLPDGQLLMGGNFTAILTNGASSASRSYIALLNSNGTAHAFSPYSDNQVTRVVRQRDGKILVAGNFNNIGGFSTGRRFIARFNADFTFDTNFHNALYLNFSTNGPDSAVSDLALQSDGKILLVGNFSSVSGKPGTRGVARLNTDGTVDETFTSRAASTSGSALVAALPDGSVLYAGTTQYGGHQSSIFRLLEDGSVDTSFSVSLGGIPTALAVETDGSIIAGGTFTTVEGAFRPLLTRVFQNGKPDTNFLAGITDYTAANQAVIRAIAIQDDGRIVAGGSFFTFGPFRNGLARIKPDGTPDSSFVFQQGVGDDYNASVWSLATFADGRIAVGGSFLTWEGAPENNLVILNGETVPLNFAGQPTDQFLLPNETALFSVSAVGTSPISYQWFRGPTALANIGNVSGATSATLTISPATPSDVGDYFVRIANASGSRDSLSAELYLLGAPEFSKQPQGSTYNVSNIVTLSATVRGVAPLTFQWLQNSNAIPGATNSFLKTTNAVLADAGAYQLVAGNSLGAVTSLVAQLKILLPPDSVSPKFGHPAGANGSILAVAPLGDGRVVIGGQFSMAGPNNALVPRSNLALLNTNGTADAAFNPAPNGQVNAVVRDAQGGFLVGGFFQSIGGLTRTHFTRLNADGSLDQSFLNNLGSGPNQFVYDVALQVDGKILVVGSFNLVSGQSYPGVVRLNTNGTIDPTFRFSGNGGQIQTVDVTSDGRIYAGGFITISNRQNLVRLNSNGSVDLTFQAAFNSSVNRVLAVANGGVLVGGFFSTVNNAPAAYFARLNSDGSLNPSWPATRPSSPVSAIAQQVDGKIIIGGQFFTVGNASRSRLARYSEEGLLDPQFAATGGPAGSVSAVSLEADGGIWLGGNFTSYSGTTANNLVLLTGDPIGFGDSPFDHWAAANGLTPANGAPDDDADLDGVFNVFEFYFGTSPISAASTAEPSGGSVQVGAEEFPTISFVRAQNASGVTLLPQASSKVDFTDSLGTQVQSVVDLGGGFERVTIRSAANDLAQPTQFLRIRLSVP